MEWVVCKIRYNVGKACSLFLAQQHIKYSPSSGVTQCKQEHGKAQMEESS